jgi:hypothetical protein
MESHLSRAGSSAADSISLILKIKCKVKKDQIISDFSAMMQLTWAVRDIEEMFYSTNKFFFDPIFFLLIKKKHRLFL